MSAGRQAAGARCQNVCSYFSQTKIRPRTFLVSPKDTPIFRQKGNNSAHVVTRDNQVKRILCGKQNQLTTKKIEY